MPAGKGPFPTIVYNYGKIVDALGVQRARERGYKLEAVCKALAKKRFLVLVPVRRTGAGNLEAMVEDVSVAIDYLGTRTDVDKSRKALIGFSRGGLLALLAARERRDLCALCLLAPAPGGAAASRALEDAGKVSAPVLLLVDRADNAAILRYHRSLLSKFREEKKDVTAIRYKTGKGHILFWAPNGYLNDIVSFLSDKKLAGESK